MTLALAIPSGFVLGWAEWVDRIVGFIDWASRAVAFGATFAGIAALVAARWAYRGVKESIQSTEKREEQSRRAASEREEKSRDAAEERDRANRETIDTRERETARHARFTTIVNQLASEHETVRIGGLYALSALADEWEREARRQITLTPDADDWEERKRDWSEAVEAWTNRTPVYMSSSDDELAIQAKLSESAADQQDRYCLRRKGSSSSTRDAIDQRDTCISLLLSFVRKSSPAPLASGVKSEKQHKEQIEDFPLAPDCQVSVEIIKAHSIFDAAYIWPPEQVNLSNTYLPSIDFSNCNLRRANFTGAHLEDARLEGANFEDAMLDGAHLEDAHLNDAHLEAAWLERAWLKGAHLERAHLERAWLVGAHLEDAHLEAAWLKGAHLEHARLNGAHLEHARLKGAHLEHARLNHAHLQNASLAGADLSDVDFSQANLGNLAEGSSCTLIDEDLSDESAPPIIAKWNSNTRWPPGFDPDAVVKHQVKIIFGPEE